MHGFFRKSHFILLSTMFFVEPNVALSQDTVPVTALNFARAETDGVFTNIVKRNGGLGVVRHDRVPAPIDEQVIVRMNRDTFYSSAVFDLEAAPVSVSIPQNDDGRFMSMQVISEDHFSPLVAYEGTHLLTEENVGTRYVLVAFRTFVDPEDESDIAAAHALQDEIKMEQSSVGEFVVPNWDSESRDIARKSLETLASLGGVSAVVRMGTKEEVDPIANLLTAATSWGLNPSYAAMYFTNYPELNDGTTVHTITLENVPADGFWSLSVYNDVGYFEGNEFDSYSVNSVTAKPSEDGAVHIQFGGCDGEIPNCIPITNGWNYSLRLYRPGSSVLDGSWVEPIATPI